MSDKYKILKKFVSEFFLISGILAFAGIFGLILSLAFEVFSAYWKTQREKTMTDTEKQLRKEIDVLNHALDELKKIMHDETRDADGKVTDSRFVLKYYKENIT